MIDFQSFNKKYELKIKKILDFFSLCIALKLQKLNTIFIFVSQNKH